MHLINWIRRWNAVCIIDGHWMMCRDKLSFRNWRKVVRSWGRIDSDACLGVDEKVISTCPTACLWYSDGWGWKVDPVGFPILNNASQELITSSCWSSPDQSDTALVIVVGVGGRGTCHTSAVQEFVIFSWLELSHRGCWSLSPQLTPLGNESLKWSTSADCEPDLFTSLDVLFVHRELVWIVGCLRVNTVLWS